MANFRVRTISILIELYEWIVFYPRLMRVYRASGGLSSVVDIGANRGQSVKMFRFINRDMRMTCVEPIPHLADFLAQKYPDIKVHNLAVSSQNGHLDFFLDEFDEVSSLIAPNTSSLWYRVKRKLIGGKEKERTVVSCRTLDDMASTSDVCSADLLKIDVEGGELDVLLGADKCLDQKLFRFIQFEFHVDKQRPNHTNEIRSLLGAHGYKRKATFRHGLAPYYDELWEF